MRNPVLLDSARVSRFVLSGANVTVPPAPMAAVRVPAGEVIVTVSGRVAASSSDMVIFSEDTRRGADQRRVSDGSGSVELEIQPVSGSPSTAVCGPASGSATARDVAVAVTVSLAYAAMRRSSAAPARGEAVAASAYVPVEGSVTVRSRPALSSPCSAMPTAQTGRDPTRCNRCGRRQGR